MTTPIEELKIRARLLCKALGKSDPQATMRALDMAARQRWTTPQKWSLSHCLNVVAAEAGFMQWEHARRVLAGEAAIGDDMGTLWYDKGCAALVNRWFSSYAEAKTCLQGEKSAYLLPYARQFIVVDSPFIERLCVSPSSPNWAAIGFDLIAGYGQPGWHRLFMERLLQVRQIMLPTG